MGVFSGSNSVLYMLPADKQDTMEMVEDVYEDDFEMDDEEDNGCEETLAADDGSKHSDSTNHWDRIVSALEDVLLDKRFEDERISFCQHHCHEFEDTAENKLVYTQLFEAYCALLEGTIESALTQAVQGFSMAEFADMLADRRDQLGAEVFDLLLSMSDFGAFKELMLDTRLELEAGPAQQALLGLTCCALPVHHEEQEDGEERPDLDTSLSISPLTSPTPTAGAGKNGFQQCNCSSSSARRAGKSGGACTHKRKPGPASVR